MFEKMIYAAPADLPDVEGAKTYIQDQASAVVFIVMIIVACVFLAKRKFGEAAFFAAVGTAVLIFIGDPTVLVDMMKAGLKLIGIDV